jgi:hypothetical protein
MEVNIMARKKNTAVFGLYKSRDSVERAITVLKDAGFNMNDLSILMAESTGVKDLGTEKHTKAPEGAATGAAVGGTLGLLAGLGALAIPGAGPFLAAGPLVAALAGIGAGGTIGGIAGALIGLGMPEYEAKRYEGRIKEGNILLSVHAEDSDWVSRAKNAFELTGAEDIGSEKEEKVA